MMSGLCLLYCYEYSGHCAHTKLISDKVVVTVGWKIITSKINIAILVREYGVFPGKYCRSSNLIIHLILPHANMRCLACLPFLHNNSPSVL